MSLKEIKKSRFSLGTFIGNIIGYTFLFFAFLCVISLLSLPALLLIKSIMWIF